MQKESLIRARFQRNSKAENNKSTKSLTILVTFRTYFVLLKTQLLDVFTRKLNLYDFGMQFGWFNFIGLAGRSFQCLVNFTGKIDHFKIMLKSFTLYNTSNKYTDFAILLSRKLLLAAIEDRFISDLVEFSLNRRLGNLTNLLN